MDEFLHYINERESIRINKESKDRTIRECRFPNISWYHDRGTKYLYDFISDLHNYDKVFYIFLYRYCGSNPRVLHLMTKTHFHDIRNIIFRSVRIKHSKSSKFKYIYRGPSFNTYLLISLGTILDDFYVEFENMKDESIIKVEDFLYRCFSRFSKVKSKMLASMIVRDLAHIFPDRINPDSECWFDDRAQEGLKLVGDSNLEILSKKSSLNYVQLNNALVGYSCYLRYKSFYKIHGYYLERWKYYKG